MKKIVFVLLAIALVVTPCLAQSPVRNASSLTYSQTRTNFGNIAVTGLNTDGNPGYIALVGAAYGSGIVDQVSRPEYYLWVDDTGDLCIASGNTMEPSSAFPNGNWGENTSTLCTKVGGQS